MRSRRTRSWPAELPMGAEGVALGRAVDAAAGVRRAADPRRGGSVEGMPMPWLTTR